MEEVMNGILIREVETKNIMTKSSLPVGGYSVNPYVGCTHACKYCYASFMKRFTGHKEEWGTFLDVKHWPEIKNPKKYAGQRVVIGSVTDGYNPQEEQFGNTRKLLEQLIGSDADILICTKSDLVVRDIDLLKKLGRVTVSWSINTLDENFKNDMDSRSYNRHEGTKNKLVLSIFVREWEEVEENLEAGKTNQIFLDGYICKEPIYRKTPLGREIADLLIAVNRPYGKSDYIPCIAWGRNARYASTFEVGGHIQIWGRVQSREYVKKINEEESEKHIAYEVSVSKLEYIDQ